MVLPQTKYILYTSPHNASNPIIQFYRNHCQSCSRFMGFGKASYHFEVYKIITWGRFQKDSPNLRLQSYNYLGVIQNLRPILSQDEELSQLKIRLQSKLSVRSAQGLLYFKTNSLSILVICDKLIYRYLGRTKASARHPHFLNRVKRLSLPRLPSVSYGKDTTFPRYTLHHSYLIASLEKRGE